ncbi:unnamed protein product, partial [Iphiclides podalirius]
MADGIRNRNLRAADGFVRNSNPRSRFSGSSRGAQSGGSARQCGRVTSGRAAAPEPSRRRPELCQTRHPEHPGAPAFHEYTSLRFTLNASIHPLPYALTPFRIPVSLHNPTLLANQETGELYSVDGDTPAKSLVV